MADVMKCSNEVLMFDFFRGLSVSKRGTFFLYVSNSNDKSWYEKIGDETLQILL